MDIIKAAIKGAVSSLAISLIFMALTNNLNMNTFFIDVSSAITGALIAAIALFIIY